MVVSVSLVFFERKMRLVLIVCVLGSVVIPRPEATRTKSQTKPMLREEDSAAPDAVLSAANSADALNKASGKIDLFV